MISTTERKERKRHIPARLKLNDASCHPGEDLLDRLASRNPDAAALAIQAAWAFRYPVTKVDKLPE